LRVLRSGFLFRLSFLPFEADAFQATQYNNSRNSEKAFRLIAKSPQGPPVLLCQCSTGTR